MYIPTKDKRPCSDQPFKMTPEERAIELCDIAEHFAGVSKIKTAATILVRAHQELSLDPHGYSTIRPAFLALATAKLGIRTGMIDAAIEACYSTENDGAWLTLESLCDYTKSNNGDPATVKKLHEQAVYAQPF